MINQPTTSEPGGTYSFIEGMEAFDVAGEKVGTVSWQNPKAGYLVIQKGWIFANELYVPYSYVVSQDSRGIFLNLSKDELRDDRWKAPPTASNITAGTNQPMAAGMPLGVAPAAAAFPGAESAVQSPAQPETPAPTDAPVQEYAEPASASAPASEVMTQEWPVDKPVDTQDGQSAAVETPADAVDADLAESSLPTTDFNDADEENEEESLQAEQPVDEVVIVEASDDESDQIDQPDPNLNPDEQALQAEQPVDEVIIIDTADDDLDQSAASDTYLSADDVTAADQSAVDQNTDDLSADTLETADQNPADLNTADQSSAVDLPAEDQPLQTAGVGSAVNQQPNDLEQRVLYRMEGAAAGVAAAQAFKHAGAAPEDNRSGAAVRAALLVGFDVALKHNAAQQLSEPGPRGSDDPVASLLAEVGPAETPQTAPLLAAAWRAALAVASENPSAAPDVRAALERLARD
jgi:hypothetical protein